MYKVGDYIIYGKTGICLVKDIGHKEVPGIEGSRLYYTLKPVFTAETIYTPVDTSVFMRPCITREEAISLIEMIPDIQDELDIKSDIDSRELPNYYKTLIETHDCKDLIQLILTVCSKNQQAIQEKRKLGQIDQNFMRDAEDILYGELSIALDVDKKNIPSFIEEMLNEKGENNIILKE